MQNVAVHLEQKNPVYLSVVCREPFTFCKGGVKRSFPTTPEPLAAVSLRL